MTKGKSNPNRNSGSHMTKPRNNSGSSSPHKNGDKNSLLVDEQNYKDTLKAYYRYMLQLPPQRQWMTHKFGLRIRDMFDQKKDIKVLSIGGGAGDVDIDFLNEIVKCGKERCGEDGYSVLYTVVEPNNANVEAFRKSVSERPEFRKVQFKWHTSVFEKFCEDFKQREYESNKFDFVHFVRVFYHFDSANAFDRTYNHLLARNGIMCGMGENENAFWPKMMYFLAKHKIDHDGFTGSGPVSQNYFLPGWLQLARDKNWKYESYIHGYDFDITPMFDPSSRDGNYLIDFAFHQKNARKNTKKIIIEDFFNMLNERKFEKIITKDGKQTKKIIFPCELGAIMITRE